MRLLWPGSRPNLEEWEKRPLNCAVDPTGSIAIARQAHFQRVLASEPPGPPLENGPFARVSAAIMRYEVFPLWLIRGALRQAPVQLGDTVGIRMRVLPGLHLFFAARVSSVFDQATEDGWQRGFTYRTVVGHPERGEQIFCVRKDAATGRVTATLRMHSAAGGPWLYRFAQPVIRCLQAVAGRGALDHLHAVADRPPT